MSIRRSVSFAFALALSVFCFIAGRAQDTRTVTEPVIPPSCTVLMAQLSSANGKFSNTDEAKLDTMRLQSALDKCAKGHAVELKAEGAKNAFLTGPISLRAGVILLVDKGVTLYASRNPKDYEVSPGSCGVLSEAQMLAHKAKRDGCRTLISADDVDDSGIMGDGTIDGRGGAVMMGANKTWWEADKQPKKVGRKTHTAQQQTIPQFIVADGVKNFTIYRITLKNAPHFHISVQRSDGVTVWGLKIDTPASAPNTDGFDPSASTNVTITHSYIRDGDDDVAIKAGGDAATNISVVHNHFYWGHGMSIGSQTSGGVNHVLVEDLSLDGTTNGIRIKSSGSRGGLVKGVKYDDVCIRGVKYPITMTTDYRKLGGKPGNLPSYSDIYLHNVRLSGGGSINVDGYDTTHRIGVQLDGVVALDSPSKYTVELANADVTLGPGPVNLRFGGGKDLTVKGKPGTGTLDGCNEMLVPFPVAP